MNYTIDSKFSSVIFIILTFLCLYLDDVRVGFTDESADMYVDNIFLI